MTHIGFPCWGDNIAIDKNQYKELREEGIIVTTSEQGRQATLKYLESVLNQSENQTLVDYMERRIEIRFSRSRTYDLATECKDYRSVRRDAHQ